MNVQKQTGFTIVELLIVIVVIGILAAITIAAFNGIQQRARVATVTSDLANAKRSLGTHHVDSGRYPDTLAEANNNQGVKASTGTTYQYTVPTGGATYCLTATNGTVSYKVSSTDQSPTEGGCAGHGVGGVSAITNLVLNPSVESNITNWGNYVAGGAATTSRATTGGYSESGFYRMSWTTATTAISGGFYPLNMGLGNLTPGNTYSASIWVRSSKNQTMRPQLTYRDAGNVTVGSTINGTAVSVTAGAWTRLSISGVAPTGAYSALMTAYATTGGSYWQPGDTLDGDAAMLTEGTTSPTYADGNSANWVWNGTINNSTSTGPAS